MSQVWLRIEIAGDDLGTIAMFEPTGMTYNLAKGEHIVADVVTRNDAETGPDVPTVFIQPWQGGVSVWAPGNVVTRDANGVELHTLD